MTFSVGGYRNWRTRKCTRYAIDAVTTAPFLGVRWANALESLLGPLEVLHAQYQAAADSVEEVDVHAGLGDAVSDATQGPRTVLGIDDEHVALLADVEARVLEDLAHRARVLDEQVHHGGAADVVPGEPLDVDPGAPDRLGDMCERSRLIRHDHGQVLQHGGRSLPLARERTLCPVGPSARA